MYMRRKRCRVTWNKNIISTSNFTVFLFQYLLRVYLIESLVKNNFKFNNAKLKVGFCNDFFN